MRQGRAVADVRPGRASRSGPTWIVARIPGYQSMRAAEIGPETAAESVYFRLAGPDRLDQPVTRRICAMMRRASRASASASGWFGSAWFAWFGSAWFAGGASGRRA